MHFSQKQIRHAVETISSRLFEENAYSTAQKTWFVNNFEVLLKQLAAQPHKDLYKIRIARDEPKLRGFFSQCQAQGIEFGLKEVYHLYRDSTRELSASAENETLQLNTIFKNPSLPKNAKQKNKKILQSFLQNEQALYLEERRETITFVKENTIILEQSYDTEDSASDVSSIYAADDSSNGHDSSDYCWNSSEDESNSTSKEYEAIMAGLMKAIRDAEIESYAQDQSINTFPSPYFDFKKKVEQKRETNQKHKNPTALLKQWQVSEQPEAPPLEEIPKHLQRKRSFNQKKR